jgi:hypothetical protein
MTTPNHPTPRHGLIGSRVACLCTFGPRTTSQCFSWLGFSCQKVKLADPPDGAQRRAAWSAPLKLVELVENELRSEMTTESFYGANNDHGDASMV